MMQIASRRVTRMKITRRYSTGFLVLLIFQWISLQVVSAFNDSNWVTMGSIGANGIVYGAVVDGSGNLYIGGGFTNVGGAFANGIAKWDGSQWTALGPGLNGEVDALAVSGNDLYVGGDFKGAG